MKREMGKRASDQEDSIGIHELELAAHSGDDATGDGDADDCAGSVFSDSDSGASSTCSSATESDADDDNGLVADDDDVSSGPVAGSGDGDSTPSVCTECQQIRSVLGDVGAVLVSCGVHTLQLAVHDAVKCAPGVEAMMKRSTRLSKKLHRSVYAKVLKAESLALPAIPNMTRWSSGHKPLADLKPLQGVCGEITAKEEAARRRRQQQRTRRGTGGRRRQGRDRAAGGQRQRAAPTAKKDLPNLTAREWALLDEVNAALEPAAIATKRMQAEQLTVGDFYGAWLVCREKTRALPSAMTAELTRRMEAREKDVLRTDAFAPAIFMDPPYRRHLEKDPDVAQQALVQL
ncbi:hypothetical protein ONE63_008154 [Megalurothrips usitatus]|uniref:Uncharacterized protein n=1 Tax=Megalurothrips usitatus TaxID=439358 RepID=A0AAV7XS50_9NEOP|nr:hypothetical protein ONE63_008154 [Megalurothrips usitatus]